MADELLTFRSNLQTKKFLSNLLSCLNDESAIIAAYCAESIKTFLAYQDTGCNEHDALSALLYASYTCEKLLAAAKRTSDEPVLDTKERRQLLKQFVQMGEVRQSTDGIYFKTATRQVHFADDLFLIVGSIPQAAVSRHGYPVSYSGSARYSHSFQSSYVTLSAQAWLPYASIDNGWLDACIKHYSMLMLPSDLGAFEGLDFSILSTNIQGGAWVALQQYRGDTTALVRVRLVNSYDYRLVSLSSGDNHRIVKAVSLDREHARQFECAHLARVGRPKRLRVIVDNDQLRFRVPRMPSLQQTTLRHISHEIDMDNGTWRAARLTMMPIIEYVARSSRVEVVIK